MKNAIDVEWVEGMPYVFFTFLGGRRSDFGGVFAPGSAEELDSSAGAVVVGRSCRMTFLLSLARGW